jgi:ribonucleoside-diphosphate reductase alpha chain
MNEPTEALSSRTAAPLFTKRTFSTAGVHPFDQIEWDKRTAEITDDAGKTIFKQENVEVPKSWSPLATKVVVSKYFYGEQNTPERESSVRQLISRVCDTIADWGLKDGYFKTPAERDLFCDELTWLSINQYGAFNSPVWFNVGLYHKYGVGKNSTKGNWKWNAAKQEAERATTQYEFPQASACFIQSVNDNMEDIMRLAYSEAMLFKFGSGTGTDLSTIRSSREKLSGGGRPSGPMSFLRVYDQVANVVKSGGKTRRAAKMNTLKDWHGDIEEFIDAKQLEEKKAWALIEQGYNGSYNGEAYGTVMYQNENLSVRVSDEFMGVAEFGGDWWTKAVTTGEPLQKKDAGKLLDKIAYGTWVCGDPGIQYDGAIQRWHTCKGTDDIHSTNPCSEYVFLNNTACNLASLNLMKFKREDGSFDVERFKTAVRVYITAQDILVDNASYPTKEIAENSHIFRTLGLGFANLGCLVMSYGMPYDSDEARGLASAITALMTGEAYAVSAEIANVVDTFPGYYNAACSGVPNPKLPDNVESMLNVIRLHGDESKKLPTITGFANVRKAAINAWEQAYTMGRDFGYRNAQVTVLAPTGTISFLMDCDTTGVEPDIALVKYKVLAGGGTLKIVNSTVESALRRLGYSEEEIVRIIEHINQFDTVEDVFEPTEGLKVPGFTYYSGLKFEHLPVFDCAFKPAKGTRSIHYMAHLKMMAACQPFISGAISKTVNMPNTATVEDIRKTYVEAWKLGLKCVAIYRDGSKRSQPLNTATTNEGVEKVRAPRTFKVGDQVIQEDEVESVLSAIVAGFKEIKSQNDELKKRTQRRRLEDTRGSITHKFEISGHKGYLTVGLFDDGSPGELFVTMSKEGSTVGGLMDTIATLTSMALQYGVPLEALVRKFSHQRFEPSGFTRNPEINRAFSIVDYIFRWMAKRFIPAEEVKPDSESTGTTGSTIVAGPAPATTTTASQPVVFKATVSSWSKEPRIIEAKPKSISESLAHMQSDAPSCPNCGSITVRNGACYKCVNCGESLGCS